MSTTDATARAQAHVWKFTAAAAATGAIPVPGASAAIVAENATMVAVIADTMGLEVSVETVLETLAAASSVNMLGRAVFVEAARAMGWFAGPFGVAGVSALGASTAALQTWVLGQLTIAICHNDGAHLSRAEARQVIDVAQDSFDFREVKRRAKAAA